MATAASRKPQQKQKQKAGSGGWQQEQCGGVEAISLPLETCGLQLPEEPPVARSSGNDRGRGWVSADTRGAQCVGSEVGRRRLEAEVVGLAFFVGHAQRHVASVLQVVQGFQSVSGDF